MKSWRNRSDRESPIPALHCHHIMTHFETLIPLLFVTPVSPVFHVSLTRLLTPSAPASRANWHLLGGKFRGQIMLSPDTLLGTGDGFTLYSAHINLLLPDNVLQAQFITSSRLTQFSFSQGRIWKWGKWFQSRYITAFGIHPTSDIHVLQLNNHMPDIVQTLLRVLTYLSKFPFLFPFPRQMIVDRNLSVMNILKQLPGTKKFPRCWHYFTKKPHSRLIKVCWKCQNIIELGGTLHKFYIDYEICFKT